MKNKGNCIAMLAATIAIACGAAFGGATLVSCGDSDTGTTHTHTFNMDKWVFDDTGHWHPATCEHTDVQGNKAKHTGAEDCSICDWEKTTTPETVHVQSVTLDKTELSLTVGDSYTLNATVLPENADNKQLSWSVTAGDAVTVDNGAVTAAKPGTATVTVTTADSNKTASCAVTVTLENEMWAGGFTQSADHIFRAENNGKNELHYYAVTGDKKMFAAAEYNTLALTYLPGAASDVSEAGFADIKLTAKDKYGEEIAVSVKNHYNYMEFLYDGTKLNSANYKSNGHGHTDWGADTEQYTLALAVAKNNVQFTVNGVTYILEDTQEFDFADGIEWYIVTDKHIPSLKDIEIKKTDLKSAQTEYKVEGNFVKQSEKDNENDILVLTGTSTDTSDRMKISTQSGKVGKTNEETNNTVEFSFRPNTIPVGYNDQNYVAFILEPASGVKLGIRFLYHWKLAWIQQGTSETAFDWGQTELASGKFLPDYDANVDNGWKNTEEWFNVKIEFTAEAIRAYVNGAKYAEAEWHDFTFDEETPCYVETRGNMSSVKGLTLSATQVAPAKPRGDWKPSGYTAVTENGETVYTTQGAAATLSYEKEVGNNNTVEFEFKPTDLTSWDAWGYLGFAIELNDGNALVIRFVHRNGGGNQAKVDMYRWTGNNWGANYTDYNGYDKKEENAWYSAKIVFTDELIRVLADGKTVVEIATPADCVFASPVKVKLMSWCHAQVKNLNLSYTNLPFERLAAYIATVKDTAETDYTENTFSAFKTALDAASALTAEASATEIAAAKTALENAFAGLITKTWQAAYDALDAAIKTVESEYNESEYAEKYTESSLKTFTDALALAKTTLGKSDATETELTGAKAALDTAKAGLIDKSGGIVSVTGVTLSKTALALNVGQSETLTATVAPENATDKTVSWSCEGDAATVSDGVVTAVKPGTATVTVTTRDGEMTAICTVTVTYSAPVWLGENFDKTTNGSDTLYTAQSANEITLAYYDIDGVTRKPISVAEYNTLSLTYMPGARENTTVIGDAALRIGLADNNGKTITFAIRGFYNYCELWINGALSNLNYNYSTKLHGHSDWGKTDDEYEIRLVVSSTGIQFTIGTSTAVIDTSGMDVDITGDLTWSIQTVCHIPSLKNISFAKTEPKAFASDGWTDARTKQLRLYEGENGEQKEVYILGGDMGISYDNGTLGKANDTACNNTVEFSFRPGSWDSWGDWGHVSFAIGAGGGKELLIRICYKNGGNAARIDVYMLSNGNGSYTTGNPLILEPFDRFQSALTWFDSIKYAFTNDKLIVWINGVKLIDCAMIEGCVFDENSTVRIWSFDNAAAITGMRVGYTDIAESVASNVEARSETAYIKKEN